MVRTKTQPKVLMSDIRDVLLVYNQRERRTYRLQFDGQGRLILLRGAE